jgi:NTP pyrophosphatase (non-canonical NTP hydrolase)
MKDLKEITNNLIKFMEERNWRQFHNPKDLALAISIEAAELNELFLWKDSDSVNKEKVRHELADVLIYSLLFADKFDLNIEEIIEEKMKINAKNYPVEKAKGNAKKYNEF